ncbi:hypothetical protein JHK87_043385 [Glycine soja]|nr:hypothetical protein JHK87_043385 [Glycine soja]
MGDCLNELGMEDLKLLEEEMDKAAKIVREQQLVNSKSSSSYCSVSVLVSLIFA